MLIFWNSLILLGSIVALWLGAVWLVEASARIAGRLGISELVIGLTVVAFGTSAPEFAVTISAALKGQTSISVGNVVGSNIFNLGFILGGVALIKAVTTTRKLVRRDGALLLASSGILLVFLYNLQINRWEGIILFAMLVAYIILLFVKKEAPEEEIEIGEFHWFEIPRLLIGLAAIVAGGHFLVESATLIARHFGVSEWVIGVTVVAAGTSAPEFATSLVAVVRGKHGISAGNLIGSNIFNLLGVLGLAAMIRPMQIDSGAYMDVVLLTGVAAVAVLFMRTGWKISRFEAGLLITLNLILWITIFMHK
ncbi:MAG TPA: sodium:calcium antiporter [Caldithrix abyssi]|uniref:Sodium:calcium antiporter n=1 Tax=Caldithrix abyssi TaxID=187145 RepID=A0A7V4U0M3_CALAY|nr:sodium:calcium antiporter [Caldithrix abyssi]